MEAPVNYVTFSHSYVTHYRSDSTTFDQLEKAPLKTKPMQFKKLLPISAMLLVVLMASCGKDAATSVSPMKTSADQLINKSSITPNYKDALSTNSTINASFVDLKTVARFGIFAGAAVSNNAGFSQINGLDVGICPGVRTSVTGFPPATIVNGAIYATSDIVPLGVFDMLTQAKQDLLNAYHFAESATVPTPATVAGDQGGKTLAPGIYKSASTLLIQSGDLILDAQGDPNAVWIFQVASALTTIGGAGGNVVLTGGAQAKNVFWQIGSSATIGDNTSFKGNVLALVSVTMNSKAIIQGRVFALNGAVILTATNIINKP